MRTRREQSNTPRADDRIRKKRHNIPSVSKPNGKAGRGDLLIKDANVGDKISI